ncbi:MAG: cupin domain-containing protein [Tissierellia bacterium]|nr:cupin domain-containing protein [Tissierellia bacterium]
MYNYYYRKPCINNNNMPMFNNNMMYNMQRMNPCLYYNPQMQNSRYMNSYPIQYDPRFRYLQYPTEKGFIELKDYGPEPFVVNIDKASKQNDNFRTALWTGDHLQLTLMSIDIGEDIGLEIHHDVDQFIRIEEGQGIVKMGDSRDKLNFQENVYDDFAFVIPAGKWHNLINTGNVPIKLYSIYAHPQHPHGTVHKTKEIAEAEEDH